MPSVKLNFFNLFIFFIIGILSFVLQIGVTDFRFLIRYQAEECRMTNVLCVVCLPTIVADGLINNSLVFSSQTSWRHI